MKNGADINQSFHVGRGGVNLWYTHLSLIQTGAIPQYIASGCGHSDIVNTLIGMEQTSTSQEGTVDHNALLLVSCSSYCTFISIYRMDGGLLTLPGAK